MNLKNLIAEKLKTKPKLRIQKAKNKFLGEEVYLRRLSSEELDHYESLRWQAVNSGGKVEAEFSVINSPARLLCFGLCDCDGNKLLSLDDVASLAQLDFAEIRPLYQEIFAFNEMDKQFNPEQEKKS